MVLEDHVLYTLATTQWKLKGISGARSGSPPQKDGKGSDCIVFRVHVMPYNWHVLIRQGTTHNYTDPITEE